MIAFFLDSIVDHLFVMEGNGVIKDFPGNYTDYRAYLKELKAAQAQEAKAQQPAQEQSRGRETAQRARKLTFKERKELEALTVEIDELTEEKNTLEALFNSGTDIPDIADKATRYSQLKDILDEKEMRWLELSDI